MLDESKDFLNYFYKKNGKLCDILLHNLMTKQGILQSVLTNKLPRFKKNPVLIKDRILLALDLNPLNDFSLISWSQF